MLPMRALRLALGELLAADVATLAPVVGNKIALIAANFDPGEDLVVGDLTLATFDGSTPLVLGSGVQPVGIDPATEDQRITMKDPAGGLRWEVTGTTDLPQNIFGFAMLDTTLADLLAVEAFDLPITLTEVGQEIVIGTARFTLVAQPMS